MFGKNSATYWQRQINALQLTIKTCQPHNVRDFKCALRYAQRKLEEIKRRVKSGMKVLD